ncbi:MAG: zinc metallopeptidase [Bacilli bacterium]|nr:zinc metallopeptidase [Bacilli bacterium]
MDFILLLLILIIPAIAQISVTTNYNKYKNVENENGLSGFEVARKILDENNLKDVHIVEVHGNLTDHYDSSRKVVRLSTEIFHGTTIAATAIAAHECGHAIQDKEGFFFMRFRSLIFPIVKIATSVSYAIIFIGLLLQALDLVYVGIAFVGLGLIFQLVTLPVEVNASKRAKLEVQKLELIKENEDVGIQKMLNAAAMTYVAGVLASALQLLKLILMFGNRRD